MRRPRSPIDTPAKVTAAREYLGLNKAELARGLRLGESAGRNTVGRWESGEIAVPGPVQIALEAMVREKR